MKRRVSEEEKSRVHDRPQAVESAGYPDHIVSIMVNNQNRRQW